MTTPADALDPTSINVRVQPGSQKAVGFGHLEPDTYELKISIQADSGTGSQLANSTVYESSGEVLLFAKRQGTYVLGNSINDPLLHHDYRMEGVNPNTSHAARIHGQVVIGGGDGLIGAPNFEVTISDVDLDADTANLSDAPGRTPARLQFDDDVEYPSTLNGDVVGLILGVNDDFDLASAPPPGANFGEEWLPDSSLPSEYYYADDELAELVLSLRAKSAGSYRLTVVPNHVRVLDDAYNQADGDYPLPNEALPAGHSSVERDLFVVADTPGVSSIEAEYRPDDWAGDDASGSWRPNDRVRVTSFRTDLDVDSNDDGVIDNANELDGDDTIEIMPGSPGAFTGSNAAFLVIRRLVQESGAGYSPEILDALRYTHNAVVIVSKVSGPGEVELYSSTSGELAFAATNIGDSMAYTPEFTPLFDALTVPGGDDLVFFVHGTEIAEVELEIELALLTGEIPLIVHKDRVLLSVEDKVFDLDIDSDNDDGFGQPDNSTAEDRIEDFDNAGVNVVHQRTGKFVPTHLGDQDHDEIPDWVDGFDRDGVPSADDISSNSRFVPMTIRLDAEVAATGYLRLDYDMTHPTSVVVNQAEDRSASLLPPLV